jgi:hypothetical protein
MQQQSASATPSQTTTNLAQERTTLKAVQVAQNQLETK